MRAASVVCTPWERRWQKGSARGRGPKPQSSGRGIITLRKERCCLRSSTVGGRGPFSPPRVTSGGQKTGCPNRGLDGWTTGEAGGPVPRKAVRSRGPQVWSESGVFRLVRDLVGGALPAVAEAVAVAVAEHGPGAITDLYGRSCHRIRQEGFF